MKKISTCVLALIAILLSAGMLCQCKKKISNEENTTWEPTASDKIFFSAIELWGIDKIYMIDITGINELILSDTNFYTLLGITLMEVSHDASKISFYSPNPDTLYFGQILGHSILIENKISGGSYRHLDWSYDDSKLIFVKSRFNMDSMYISKADGTELSFIGIGNCPQWSPDGNRILFCLSDSIYTTNQDGTERINIAKGTNPVWTPNGLSIYFYNSGAWWNFDISGSQINKLFDFSATNVSSCVWSPGRTKLCYQSYDGDLFVMNRDGSSLTEVFDSYPYNSSSRAIHWSPDGTHIIFSFESKRIFIVTADGSKVHEIVPQNGSWFTCIDWR